MSAAPALQVHPKLRAIELRRVLLVGMAGFLMAGGMASFAIWRGWQSLSNPNPFELALVAASAFMAGLIGYGARREMRVSLDRLKLTERLAKDGTLAIVDVVTTRKDENGFRVMLRYSFRTPTGVVHEANMTLAEGGAYRVGESDGKSLALLSRDERQGLLLTRSGYPLLNAAEVLANASTSANRSRS
jgi:hypothetical protein